MLKHEYGHVNRRSAKGMESLVKCFKHDLRLGVQRDLKGFWIKQQNTKAQEGQWNFQKHIEIYVQ